MQEAEVCIFYHHIPKCGGTSVKRALLERPGSIDLGMKVRHKATILKRIEEKRLFNARAICGHRTCFFLENYVSSHSWHITFVREPVELYYSLYRFWSDICENPLHPLNLRTRDILVDDAGDYIGFEQFLAEFRFDCGGIYARMLFNNLFGKYTPGQPISSFSERHVAMAMASIDGMDFIGDMCSIQADYGVLVDMFGLAALPHLNASSSVADYVEDLTDAAYLLRQLAPSEFELYEHAIRRRENIMGELAMGGASY